MRTSIVRSPRRTIVRVSVRSVFGPLMRPASAARARDEVDGVWLRWCQTPTRRRQAGDREADRQPARQRTACDRRARGRGRSGYGQVRAPACRSAATTTADGSQPVHAASITAETTQYEGDDRNRTGVQGFAGLCPTTRPRRPRSQGYQRACGLRRDVCDRTAGQERGASQRKAALACDRRQHGLGTLRERVAHDHQQRAIDRHDRCHGR